MLGTSVENLLKSVLFIISLLTHVFLLLSSSTECVDEEYDCEDETCIDASLVCNGRNNCKFQKDESECGVSIYILIHTTKAFTSHMTQKGCIIRFIMKIFELFVFIMWVATNYKLDLKGAEKRSIWPFKLCIRLQS